jgi:hypothetical protein
MLPDRFDLARNLTALTGLILSFVFILSTMAK